MADLRGSEQDLVPAAAEIVPPRYRHPGDVVLLIGSAVWLLVALGVALIAGAELLGHRAAVVPGTEPGSTVGRVLVGLVQVIAVLAPVVVVAALLVVRRFRLLASLIVAAVAAGAAWTALSRLAGTDRPADLLANRATGSLISTAAWPGVAWFAGAVAVTLVAGSWLSLSWRRVVWLVLAVAAASELIAGVALPMELVLAFAVGSLVGAGVLVVFGAPDHRIGERGIAEALAAAGIPVRTVRPAEEAGKGSRPFVATLRDGQRRFVKVLGRDERHADLLYRGYRLAWLRGVGDTRPAASLKQAVEHQALVGMTAERAGVRVPHVHRIAVAADGSAMLIMDLVTGQAFERAAADDVTDELLRAVWQEVERLHSAGIAHRSLRTANLMVGESRLPWIVDFSFSELVATERQMALDRAELLASLAVVVGPDRAATTAAAVLGDGHLASAVPLLQPLALSHATRRAVGGQGDLLSRTRAAAAAASSAPPSALPRLQRVRPRTLLMIAAAAGAFYFVLPQLAQVSGSWRAFQSADWAWVPLILVLSFLTYVASGISLLGTLAQRLPFGPTLLTQWASSFVNRVSPANVGGMALNARFLQKCGVDPGSSVAAIGLNAAGWRHRPCRPAGRLLRMVEHRADRSLQAAVLEQAPARSGSPGGGRGRGDRHPMGTTGRAVPGRQRRAFRAGEPAPGRPQPPQAHPSVRRLDGPDARLHRGLRCRGTGLRRRHQLRQDRHGVPGGIPDRGRGSHSWRSRAAGGGADRRSHRLRHAQRPGGFGRAHLPAGHILAPRAPRVAVIAPATRVGLRMTLTDEVTA